MSKKRVDNEQIIIALLTHQTQAEAARSLGLEQKTIQRKLKDESFQEAYRAYKKGILEQTANQLITANTQAVETLTELLHDANSSVRIAAVKTVLSYSKEFTMLTDLQDRLERLEKLQNE